MANTLGMKLRVFFVGMNAWCCDWAFWPRINKKGIKIMKSERIAGPNRIAVVCKVQYYEPGPFGIRPNGLLPHVWLRHIVHCLNLLLQMRASDEQYLATVLPGSCKSQFIAAIPLAKVHKMYAKKYIDIDNLRVAFNTLLC